MTKTNVSSKEANAGDPPTPPITSPLKSPTDWRSATLARIRTLIQQADPEVVEKVKWRKPSNPTGVPVWSHGGIICTGETYKNVVKLTFARGAALPDAAGLFNSSLDGNTRRAIDIHEDDEIDAQAFQALIRASVALNMAAAESGAPRRQRRSAPRGTPSRTRRK
jgi:hypothetical protein